MCIYSKDWICSKCRNLRTYNEKQSDPDFADEIVPMAEDIGGLQILTDRLNVMASKLAYKQWENETNER